jgi:AcrR family transcriptional regulator
MKQPSQDRRTQRTQGALRGAFIDLVLDVGYEAISVADIVQKANIGRSTFYQHYSGKLEVLEDTMKYPSRHLADIVGADPAPDDVVPILLHFWDQRQRNRPFFSDPVRGVWMRVLAGMIEPRLAAMARGTRPLVPLPLAALQIAQAQMGLVIGWLAGRSAAKPIDMARALVRTTQALTAALLER